MKRLAIILSLLLIVGLVVLRRSPSEISESARQSSNVAEQPAGGSESTETTDTLPFLESATTTQPENPPAPPPIGTNEFKPRVDPGQYVDSLIQSQRLAIMYVVKENLRKQFQEEGLHQDIAAREVEWKEKSKDLKLGMTVAEAIAVMGAQPNSQIDLPPESPKDKRTFIEYSPDPNARPMTKPLKLPYDSLTLVFDTDGKLTKITWHYP